jgi:hypothetical protein
MRMNSIEFTGEALGSPGEGAEGFLLWYPMAFVDADDRLAGIIIPLEDARALSATFPPHTHPKLK